MRSPSRRNAALGPAVSPAGSRAATRARILEQITRNIDVADRLGLVPLTIDERAAAMLAASCAGWQLDRRCVDDEGRSRQTPHPACLRAQYNHDLFLVEHGLFNNPIEAGNDEHG